jgi:hypothetical protein
MKSTLLWGVCAASIFLAGAVQANGSWQIIPVDIALPGHGYNVTVGDEVKEIYPSCALGEPYSFHFKSGNLKKLVVYFNGGGACWDSNTCVGSLQVPPPQQPAYVHSTAIQNDPAEMGGMLDENNDENPYADWSMLFISYCTGDVHLGSADTDYANPIPGPPVTIHHRGFDNFLYAINWLKHNHPEIRPDKLLVAGSSAGSYGAMVNFPTLKRYYHGAKMFGFGDGGMGVFGVVGQIGMPGYRDASNFATAVFGEPSIWNIHENLHPIFASLPSAVLGTDPNYEARFLPEVYNRLSDEYPEDKFAQYTTAYDAIQTLFWDIMLNPDTPLLWGAGLTDPLFIGEWNDKMNTITGDLRASLPKKYHSYIGPGCNHTILSHNDDFYSSYLTSSKGKTITFLQWLTAMTKEKNADKKNWQNLSCTPGVDCGEESLTDAGIQACLARTFDPQP